MYTDTMLLGFKRQFAPWVKDGTKRHTIRAKRKRRPRPGETCNCYVDPRQKTMELLGRWRCMKVENIAIYPSNNPEDVTVFIAGVLLDSEETEAFLWRDGFRPTTEQRAEGLTSTKMAARHWRKVLKEGRFDGDLIHWDFYRPMQKPAKRKRVVLASSRSKKARARR